MTGMKTLGRSKTNLRNVYTHHDIYIATNEMSVHTREGRIRNKSMESKVKVL